MSEIVSRRIKVVPNDSPNADGRWIEVRDSVAGDATTLAEAMLLFRDQIPDGHSIICYEVIREDCHEVAKGHDGFGESIDLLISLMSAKKSGNREFILTSHDSNTWIAAIGNKSQHVSIGEILSYGAENVEFYAEGPDPLRAVMALYKKVAGL